MGAPTMAQREIKRRLNQVYNVLQQVSALDQLAHADDLYGSWEIPRVVVDPATYSAFKSHIDKAKILEDWGSYLWVDAGQGKIVCLAINANAQEDIWRKRSQAAPSTGKLAQ